MLDTHYSLDEGVLGRDDGIIAVGAARSKKKNVVTILGWGMASCPFRRATPRWCRDSVKKNAGHVANSWS